jgi:hypothetical protein
MLVNAKYNINSTFVYQVLIDEKLQYYHLKS